MPRLQRMLGAIGHNRSPNLLMSLLQGGETLEELLVEMKLTRLGKMPNRDLDQILDHLWQSSTLPETNIAPENGWLEYYFPIGEAYFQGLR